MNKISTKKYRCGTCFNIQEAATNHFNEIYSKRKCCKSTVLECIEPEAIENKNKKTKSTAIVHFYSYHLDIPEEANEYYKIVDEFNQKQKFSTFIDYGTFDYLRSNYNKTEINIYNKDTFIGDGVRWHTWFEKVVPSDRIKTGYYLEFKDI